MKSVMDRALRWAIGNDTGASSKAIAGHMTGNRPSSGYPPPWDPSDFGRCMRLVAAIPEWRPRLPEMAKRSPEWAGIVKHWDRIEQCMRAELADGGGRAPATYDLIKQALAEGKAAALTSQEQNSG